MVTRWGWGSGLLPVFMAFLANIRPHSSIGLILYPQSERLCLVCPLVSVHVRSTLVGRIDRVPLFARIEVRAKQTTWQGRR